MNLTFFPSLRLTSILGKSLLLHSRQKQHVGQNDDSGRDGAPARRRVQVVMKMHVVRKCRLTMCKFR
ncbi:hypothetical protein E2C01_004793 [Portunus trituberculatus]|uniref:Uncharacterized protein n=1 Tax=Portunus trituberculatus TaxID=210409 RepID=A0A5B7CSA5_PORTR|nr:hypothetical protein [Portunus trituberculatus]